MILRNMRKILRFQSFFMRSLRKSDNLEILSRELGSTAVRVGTRVKAKVDQKFKNPIYRDKTSIFTGIL